MNLIAIGDNVVDCYLDQKKYYPGGNCVNVAVNAKQNGADHVAYIGIFGSDEKAEHIKFALNQEKVDYQFSRMAIGKSGQPQVSLTEDGDRVFVGGPKDTVQHKFKIQLINEDIEYISKFNICHVSCYSSMESELPRLSSIINISFDFSNRLDLDYIASIAPYVKYAFFSASELADSELDEFIEELSQFNFDVVALTRGGHPAIFIHNGEIYEQKLRTISVLDTMGAGDSLIGGFLVHYLNGETMETAIQKATESAEKTCGVFGGFGYPNEL